MVMIADDLKNRCIAATAKHLQGNWPLAETICGEIFKLTEKRTSLAEDRARVVRLLLARMPEWARDRDVITAVLDGSEELPSQVLSVEDMEYKGCGR